MSINIDIKKTEIQIQQTAQDTSAATKMEKAMERHGQLITDLLTFIKGKSNVHMDIRNMASSLGSFFRRIRELEMTRTAGERPLTSIGVAQTSPWLLRKSSEMVKSTETDEDEMKLTTKPRQTRNTKRRKRNPPGLDTMETKKRKERGTTPSAEQQTQAANNQEWQKVTVKKTQKKRGAATRPNALLIRPKDKEKYSEILKRVKEDVLLEQIGDCVDKIRKMTTGDMLIVLTKEDADKALGLQRAIAELLGDETKVLNKVQEEDLEIKDLDEATTKKEVLEALRKAAGEDCKITAEAIKFL